jgi:hypothetical protein
MTRFNTSKDKKLTKLNDKFAVDLIAMSRAHMLYLSFLLFRQRIDAKTYTNPKSKEVLLLLAKTFALKQLSLDSVTLYEVGFLKSGAKHLMTEAMKDVLNELRPHMVSLVELNTRSELDLSYLSAIGNEYGDIYETQLEWAMNSRLNKNPIPDYYKTIIRPIYHGEKL